jgi:hypothetical protein
MRIPVLIIRSFKLKDKVLGWGEGQNIEGVVHQLFQRHL